MTKPSGFMLHSTSLRASNERHLAHRKAPCKLGRNVPSGQR